MTVGLECGFCCAEHSQSSVQLCVEARMVLLSVLSRNAPDSLPGKAAGYNYIAKLAAICRMQHLPPEHGEPGSPVLPHIPETLFSSVHCTAEADCLGIGDVASEAAA